MANGLTNKQELFTSHYLKTWNATQAAIEAGYSAKTAYSQGQRLLKNVEIAAAVKERIDAAVMSADEVLARLAEHGRADIDDLLDRDGELDLEKARAAGVTRLIKKLIVSERTIYPKSGGEIYTKKTTVELHDAQAALINIGRHHALFTDKTRVEDWQSDIVAALRDGRITPADVRAAYPDLAARFFAEAGINATINSD